MNQNNQICVEYLFHSNGYIFNRDEKFTIIERIQKDLNIKSIDLEDYVVNWITVIRKSGVPLGVTYGNTRELFRP